MASLAVIEEHRHFSNITAEQEQAVLRMLAAIDPGIRPESFVSITAERLGDGTIAVHTRHHDELPAEQLKSEHVRRIIRIKPSP